MAGPAAAAAETLAARIVALPSRTERTVRDAVERALTDGYVDAAGRTSERAVEPSGLLTAEVRWYLIARCRTRAAGRGLRLDRITQANPTEEPSHPHDLATLLHGSAADATPPTALVRA
ncbi:WYL domain-containing protein [Streptomyces sp. NPDC006670]|uniref:WYL domain-containing protein n=1 Tax=Streptomyces sp. NPDC006670 TaxID=3154476 RepID=UPI0033E76FF5